MVIKLTTLIVFVSFMHLSAAVFSQNINMSEKNVSLSTVFNKLEKQTGYTFFYKTSLIKQLPNVDVDLQNATLEHVLDAALSNSSLTYTIVGKTVVIKSPARGFTPPMVFIGRVVDENDLPLPGVTIRIKGTVTASATDAKGQFTVAVMTTEGAVMQFSSVAYLTQEIAVKDLKNPVLIKMKEDISNLDQVQVLAYGSTSKRLNTSNTVTITADEIAKNPVQNILDVLKNRVPGMFIQQNTGLPGGSYEVSIRGTSSFNANAPLYIIDGVTYPANAQLPFVKPGGNRNQFLGGNALNYLNPADVESINVLKDADATAIYGSRGAYGVILITTKKGKTGAPRLNVNSNTGLTLLGTFPNLLNTADYLMLRREAFKNDGLTPGAGDKDINGTWPEDRYTNWQKELMGTHAVTNDFNATYSGGSGNTNFLIAANYNKQGSIELGKGSNRGGTFRFDVNNTTPNQKFYIDLSGSYSSTTNDAVPLDFSGATSTVSAPNATPLINPDGSLNWENGSNPLASQNISYRNVINNLLANSTLRYTPVKGLTLTVALGYNLLMGNEFRATPTSAFNPATNSLTQTTSYTNSFNTRTINLDPNVKYQTRLGSKGTLLVSGGATLQDQLSNLATITGTNFTTDAFLVNPALGVSVSSNYDKAVTRYLGFFDGLNYNWDGKYILNFNSRTDLSTKFGPNHRTGTFASIGGAWLFSEEKWFKNHVPFISFGKINGSYGTTGGDGIPNYTYLSRFSAVTTPYQGTTPLLPSSPANPDLHWELNKKTSVGLTLEFLNGRIGVEGNWFKTLSTDLITQTPLATITGFNQFPINSPGVIQNTGLEFILNTRNINGKNLKWSSNINITIPRNKLLSYPSFANLPLNFNYEVGRSLNGIKVYQYAGVDPATGNYFFTTKAGVTGQNLTSLVQGTDYVAFIDMQPRFFGSFTNDITYKAFKLGFTFTGLSKVGKNFLGQQQFSFGTFNTNSVTAVLRRWQKPGDITDVPKVSTSALNDIFQQNNFRQSTGAYEEITYAQLQNVNLTYNFTTAFLKKAHIAVLSLYVQGQNLFYISKYGDANPENMSATATPPLKVFTAGFNVTF